MAQFAASELTLDKEGKVYHLGIGPGDVTDTLLLVGDQDRVHLVAGFFDSVRFEKRNREFCTITGTYRGKPISVMSTGIGTDNIDIVLNELDAAVNIDLTTRLEHPVKKSLKLVRIGTCGSLREEIPTGSHIISKYAIGLDGLAGFYNMVSSDDEKAALLNFLETTKWSNSLNIPYLRRAPGGVFDQLRHDFTEGITITANGFYGPQGRAIRVPLSQPDFKEQIRKFSWNGTPVANLEMETSGLYALSAALGHEAVTVCLALANRYSGTFEPDYGPKMAALVQLVLDRLTK